MSQSSPTTCTAAAKADPAAPLSVTERSENATLVLRDINRCSVRPNDLITHRGYAVLVTGTRGWIHGDKEGFFLHQTRHLSRFAIKIENADPKFISANAVDHHFLTAYHFAPSPAGRAAGPKPEDSRSTGGGIVQKGIELQVNTFVGDGLHLDIFVTNHALAPTDVVVSFEFDADFADLNETQAGKRQQNAPVERTWSAGDTRAGEQAEGELAFHYRHARLQLATRLKIVGGDALVDASDSLKCTLSLAPQEPRTITIDLAPIFEGKIIEPFFRQDGTFAADAPATLARQHWLEGCAKLRTDNAVVQGAWDQAVSDLASLQLRDGPDDESYMLVAGVPNYTGLFGRDAFVTALQARR